MIERISRSFGWGIVGTGEIAHRFAADLRHAPGAAVAAVQSRSIEKAQAFAAQMGGRACSKLGDLLADAAVDAVYIATPNALHAAQALEAIAAGKPVLVEKPLASSGPEARRIREAAEAAGVFAMEAIWSRFLPAVRTARDVVSGGAIGPVTAIRADLSYHRDETGDSRFFDPSLGGGAALDLGVYPLSLALFLLGLPDTASGSWEAAGTGVDRRMSFELRWPGAAAHLSCGFDRNGANHFLIEGTRGTLRIEAPFLKAQRLATFRPFLAQAPLIGAKAVGNGLPARVARRLPIPGRRLQAFPFPGSGLQFEAAAVRDAVHAGAMSASIAPLADSIAVLDIIDQVRAGPPSRSPLCPAL